MTETVARPKLSDRYTASGRDTADRGPVPWLNALPDSGTVIKSLKATGNPLVRTRNRLLADRYQPKSDSGFHTHGDVSPADMIGNPVAEAAAGAVPNRPNGMPVSAATQSAVSRLGPTAGRVVCLAQSDSSREAALAGRRCAG